MPHWMQKENWWRVKWYLALRDKWDNSDPRSEYAAWLVATLEVLWAHMHETDRALVQEAFAA